MKVYSSLQEKQKKQEKKLISKDGKIKFNNNKEFLSGKGKKKSSQKWLQRQVNDPFVSASKIEGYLSRAVYKFIEIQNKYNVIKSDAKNIIELGSSPGSWTQAILTDKNSSNKKVIGVDLLPMKFYHKNLMFIQGDFEDKNIKKEIVSNLCKKKADCILSDIAMNSIGDAETDRLRSERIIESEIEFCKKYLIKGGNFVCKSIKGADNAVFDIMRNMFEKSYRFKPKSSRKDSSEIYLIGIDKKTI